MDRRLVEIRISKGDPPRTRVELAWKVMNLEKRFIETALAAPNPLKTLTPIKSIPNTGGLELTQRLPNPRGPR